MKNSFNAVYADLKPPKAAGILFVLLVLASFIGFAICGYLVTAGSQTYNETTSKFESNGPPFWIVFLPFTLFIATPITAYFYYSKKSEEVLQGLQDHANTLSEKYQAHGLELLFTRETESYTLTTTSHHRTRITPNYVYLVRLMSLKPSEPQQFITFVHMPVTATSSEYQTQLPMYSRQV